MRPIFDQALCAETDPEIFYPDKGGTAIPAKKICRSCVHFQGANECLEDALAFPDGFGIRGGFTERERQAILKQRKSPTQVSK